jgi:hypothetical protein
MRASHILELPRQHRIDRRPLPPRQSGLFASVYHLLVPEDWSHEEVEATVAAYLTMLEQELRGVAFNKSDSRRLLRETLNDRSDGAIERKHQNISAVLIELGFP